MNIEFDILAGLSNEESDFNPLDIDEKDTAARKWEKRMKRLADCHKNILIFRNPYTGKSQVRLFECGLPECPTCAAKRADNSKRQIEKAVFENETVYSVETDNPSIINKIKKAGKDNYKSFPMSTENDMCRIFFVSETPIEGASVVTADAIETDYDWLDISLKRKGKRTSGFLGKTKNEENTGTVKVKLAYVVSETDDITLVNVCNHETDLETPDLNPKTQEELEEAVFTRSQLSAEKQRAKGIVTTIRYKTWHVDLSRIDWLSNTRDNFNTRTSRTARETLEQLEIAQLAQFSS